MTVSPERINAFYSVLYIVLYQNCISGTLWDVTLNSFTSYFKKIVFLKKKKKDCFGEREERQQ